MNRTQPGVDTPTFETPKRKRLEYVPGQYFVRIHPGAVRPHLGSQERLASFAELTFTSDMADSIPLEVAEPLDYLRENAGLKNVRPLSADAVRARVQHADVSGRQRDQLAVAASVMGEQENEDQLAGIAIAELDPKVGVANLRRAESAGAIDFIEPVPARWLAGATVADPHHNLQWGLRAIRWFDAQRPDASSMSVGIIDTGIDEGHPDFEGVEMKYDHVGTRAEDIVGHGTHVAGIIAAMANNAVGIAGVASCPLQMWKVFPDEPHDDRYYTDPDRFADALLAASRAGISALNISLGGTGSAQTEQLLIQRLIDNGVTVVASMGNEAARGNPTLYPAAYDGVLAVGAIAETRERSSFSSTGPHIGICAPGSNILSTLPCRKSAHRSERMYAAWSGTSMAAPHVTAAALVAAKHPTFGPAEIKDRLRETATRLPAMGPRRRTHEYGVGALDLHAALS
jgi:subtilisin family serine protease